MTNEIASPHSAHYNVTSAGGPTLWSRRESDAQYAGKVVDLIIIKPGRWTNSTEGFIRESVNLGLGEAAGNVAYESYREYNSISSGWAYLVGRLFERIVLMLRNIRWRDRKHLSLKSSSWRAMDSLLERTAAKT